MAPQSWSETIQKSTGLATKYIWLSIARATGKFGMAEGQFPLLSPSFPLWHFFNHNWNQANSAAVDWEYNVCKKARSSDGSIIAQNYWCNNVST